MSRQWQPWLIQPPGLVFSDPSTPFLRRSSPAAPDALLAQNRAPTFVRLDASTYPDEIVGLILVDAYSERFETLLTPAQWQALVRLNVRIGWDTVQPVPGYGDIETTGFGKDNAAMRQAAATTPLRPMPLAVLAHARPFGVPESEELPSNTLESVMCAGYEDLVTPYGIEHNSEGIESFCVMQMARSLVNEAPTNKMMASGKKTSKAPKLHEAYKHFFGRDLEGAHDAMTDCLACKDIFFKIREIEAPKKQPNHHARRHGAAAQPTTNTGD